MPNGYVLIGGQKGSPHMRIRADQLLCGDKHRLTSRIRTVNTELGYQTHRQCDVCLCWVNDKGEAFPPVED
jgi:hypothetical protein